MSKPIIVAMLFAVAYWLICSRVSRPRGLTYFDGVSLEEADRMVADWVAHTTHGWWDDENDGLC